MSSRGASIASSWRCSPPTVRQPATNGDLARPRNQDDVAPPAEMQKRHGWRPGRHELLPVVRRDDADTDEPRAPRNASQSSRDSSTAAHSWPRGSLSLISISIADDFSEHGHPGSDRQGFRPGGCLYERAFGVEIYRSTYPDGRSRGERDAS
jgi:hypothetical protein